MKAFLTLLFLAPCMALSSLAQDDKGTKITELSLESRVGFNYEAIDGHKVDQNIGFRGKYINLRFEGQIVKGLNFSYRQRLNKNSDQTFFDATDWLHVDWSVTDRLTFAAGKQVVAIGGYEYDRAPIDLYTCSEFWNNIACYQLGASISYQLNKNHSLLLQVCNSPLRSATYSNAYGINLIWNGKTGFWETIYSTNIMQYAPGKWMNYIALGNRFLITNGLHLDVDLMNRTGLDSYAFKDFSIMSELSYQPNNALRCFAKYTYDQNKSGTSDDLLVQDGTQLQMASLGVEWAPINAPAYRNALRLYALGSYNWGTNTNKEGTMCDRQVKAEAGVKFYVNVLDGINRLFSQRR